MELKCCAFVVPYTVFIEVTTESNCWWGKKSQVLFILKTMLYRIAEDEQEFAEDFWATRRLCKLLVLVL